MAIFKSKTNKKESIQDSGSKIQEAKPVKSVLPESSKPKAKSSSGRPSALAEYANVLVRPRITEKAANMTAEGVYTFDIRKSATKRDVAMAVHALYKVMPVKVNVVNTPAKRVQMRKKRGFGKTAASRKALVFLKKGDTIRFS